MQLRAALADCLPLPWLVSHAARVCVSVIDVVLGVVSSELCQLSRRGWWRTQLRAALANCLPLPWLVGHAARVCIGGEPPSSLLSPVEEVVVVGGAHSSELRC